MEYKLLVQTLDSCLCQLATRNSFIYFHATKPDIIYLSLCLLPMLAALMLVHKTIYAHNILLLIINVQCIRGFNCFHI